MKKTILITGASSGIGRAAAELFSSKGWDVAATMRRTGPAKDWAAAHHVKLYELDVNGKPSVDAAVKKILEDLGHIDVLLNNAGYGLTGPLESATEEQVMQQFQTNVFGVMRCIQAVLPACGSSSRASSSTSPLLAGWWRCPSTPFTMPPNLGSTA